MKAMKNKKNKKNKSQKAQQSFTERIAKAAGGFKERAKSMNSEEKAEQAQQPEQPETQAQQESGEAEVDVKALQAELEKAKAQSDEYLDLAQRKQAEFANYRRRTEGIRAEAFDDGRAARPLASCSRLWITLSGRWLRRAKKKTPSRAAWKWCFARRRDALTKMGVEEIDPQGKPFDAELMNAVMQGTAEEGEPGTVCWVLQKGYKLGERVIRHAMVKVVAG